MRTKDVVTAALTLITLICICNTAAADESDGNWSVDWDATVSAAVADDSRPILVKYEASWCGPCRMLTEIMQSDEIVGVLNDFHTIRIDVDQPPENAPVEKVEALPTLRVITATGVTLREHVGLMQPQQLIQWLDDSQGAYRDALTQQQLAISIGSGGLDGEQITMLIKMLDDRSPERRAAAMGLLTQRPRKVSSQVIELFSKPVLRSRIAALGILSRWTAPVDGLDPWRPKTITDSRLEKLRRWSGAMPEQSEDAKLFSTPSNRAIEESELELDRLVRRGEVRGGLAVSLVALGPQLLPNVVARLESESSDMARQRLASVRFRLVSSPALAIRLPGTADQLASMDSGLRRTAAKRLSDAAKREDIPLLETLFGHRDALVRELALRGLQNAGGGSSQRLAKLLDDPDMNVRAAVLKQWLDNPVKSLVEPVSRHAMQETDASLLVYYARLLKEIDSTSEVAVAALQKLSKHDDWQVRAEVAEAISKHVKKQKKVSMSSSKPAFPPSYQKIARQLAEDADSFVLSKIVPAILEADQKHSFRRLLEIAWKFPEIRNAILPKLKRDLSTKKTAEFLRERFASNTADHRAFALEGMSRFAVDGHEEFIVPAIRDPSVPVRVAAARAISAWLDKFHSRQKELPPTPKDGMNFSFQSSVAIESGGIEFGGKLSGGFNLLNSIGAMFGGKQKPASADKPEPEPMALATGNTEPLADKPEPKPMALATGNAEPLADKNPKTTADGPQKPSADSDANDRWLSTWREAPETVLPWVSEMKESLLELAESGDDETRAYATLAAVRLGATIEVSDLLSLTEHVTNRESRLHDLYPWLEHSVRVELLETVGSLPDGDAILTKLFEQARRYDPKDYYEAFWNSLRKITPEHFHQGWSLRRKMMVLETGQQYFSSDDPKVTKRFADSLSKQLQQVNEPVARLIGLSVLGELDSQQVADLVGDAYANSELDDALRRDYARFAIAALPEPESLNLSLRMLEDDLLMPVGLAYVAEGYEGVSNTEIGSIEVPGAMDIYSTGALIVAKVSPRVDIADILPLVEHQDSAVVAMATFVLVVLGEDVDLAPLEREARKEGLGGYLSGATDLLVLAIAFRGHDQDVSILEEVYDAIRSGSQWTLRDLYWKIRIMSGPNVLKLRKRMREEVGISKLISG